MAGWPTDRVWVTAAAGNRHRGRQIARKFGCRVTAGVGSDEKLELVKRLGADTAINYRRPDFETALRQASGGQGVDVALEVVGGEVFRATLRQLAPGIVVARFAADLQVNRFLGTAPGDMPRAKFIRL
jgi:NADPH2:quinone reductase